MILYSIVPPERIFAAEGPAEPETALQTASVNGRRLLVRPQGNGEGEIVRLLSTDPDDFFDPRWQPGRLIRLS